MPTYRRSTQLSPQQELILRALKPWFRTPQQLADEVGTSPQVIKNQVFKIRERGGPMIEADHGWCSRGYRLHG